MFTALLTASLLCGAPAEAAMTDTLMSNALRVVVQEIHYSPVVAVAISYGVGSMDETDGRRGISHFCEHMMFRGTASMPGERLWQVIQRDGGWANAFTSNDVTLYFEVLPSSRLVDALAIESDRMPTSPSMSARSSSRAGGSGAQGAGWRSWPNLASRRASIRSVLLRRARERPKDFTMNALTTATCSSGLASRSHAASSVQ